MAATRNGAKWSDLPDAYYFSYDDLMKWIFTKKWPDKDKATAQIHTRKVLQFIQLKPENPHPTQWLFVGAYDVLDEYTENDGKILYRYNEIPEYASLKARAVVYYKRDPGYTGVVFNLSNNEERRRGFLKTMTLEKIAPIPRIRVTVLWIRERSVDAPAARGGREQRGMAGGPRQRPGGLSADR